MILVYIAYPYTSNPSKNTEEVRKIALKLIKKYPEIVPLIPHYCFNFAKKNPEDIKKQTTEEHVQSISWELEAIGRCDCFIIGKELNYDESTGVTWEYCYAKSLGKPIYEASDLLKRRVNLAKEVRKFD